jgi:hypothetical protein
MSTIYQNTYFRLVLGFIILLSFGLLYYVIQTRGKIIEGNTGAPASETAAAPAAAPASASETAAAPTSEPAAAPTGGVVSSISTTPGVDPSFSISFQRDDGGKPTIAFTGLRTAPPSGEVKTETIFYISAPTELMVENYKTLTIVNTATQSPSSAVVTYAIDDVINICDSTVVSDLFFSDVASALINRNSSPQTITTVKQCVNENKIKIIATHTALPTDSTGLVHTFKIQGFKIPVVSPLQIIIETVSSTNITREVKEVVIPAAPTTNFVRPVGFTDSTFKIALSDNTPGAKNITAKYAFKFTSSSTDFVIEKDDSVIYFIFSSDFVLPPIENVKVAINNVLLDAGKNEYVLQHKTTCITPGKDSSLFVDSSNYKFESENKLCINIYMLYLKQNLTVTSNEFTVALKGLTNPSYSPPPVAYDKKDFLFRAFNTSYCIMNLKIRTLGRYLFNPKSEDYIHAGFYMRGNYPLKNVKPVEDEKSGSGENSGDAKMKLDAATNKSIESRGGSNRAANVYTVNYFYDGQGQGEYGYIARPDIFGTTPYSYGTSRGGLGTSDKYVAKHKRDLEEEKRIKEEKLKQWKASQIRPPMGVAPALLNAGVQPYDSTINF